MNQRDAKTAQWIETKFILGGALLKLYAYDGAGRVTGVHTLHVTRRSIDRLLHRMDEAEDDFAQEPLPF